jgi:hypothetical protein
MQVKSWLIEHALLGLKGIVDSGTEDKTVTNCRWSPELKHIHRLQKGVHRTQAAEETQGRREKEMIILQSVFMNF